LNEIGTSVAVFNNRGLGGVPFKVKNCCLHKDFFPKLNALLQTARTSNCEDAYEVINYIKKKYPDHRIIAIGTSLGGYNNLLKPTYFYRFK
jgi:predicted alpha/beta-fold hydrolase